MTSHTQNKKTEPGGRPSAKDAPDLHEQGAPINGKPQRLNRRLFFSLQAFDGVRDISELVSALHKAGIAGVLYADMNNARGAALLTFSEDENYFVTTIRDMLSADPFVGLTPRREHTMFGRTYALGYERDLEDWLIHRPARRVLDPEWPWAIWYPLKRKDEFARLPQNEQKMILREHGAIGISFGQAEMALDVRLACHGLDNDNNDFVIGLLGKRLHPLSALVERMRGTVQTSTYMEHMGPFFIGRTVWQGSGE